MRPVLKKQKLWFLPKFSDYGFTLLELLVVIAVIGILVTILVTAINPVRLIGQSRDSRQRSDLQQIKAAMQLYYNDCKFYPTSLPSGSWGDVSSSTCDDGSTYMRQVPASPSGPAYLYAVSPVSCDNSTTLCSNYTIGADLNYPTTDDGNTLTKCSAPVPTGTHNFRVCND